MSLAEFTLRLAGLGVLVGGVGALALRAERRYLAQSGAFGALGAACIACCVLLLGCELLGLLGLLRAWALVTFGLLCAAAARALRPTPASGVDQCPRGPAPATRAAGAAALLLAAQWAYQSYASLGGGMSYFDTLWYHMPFAARFAQSGSISALHFTQSDPLVALFPANTEVFHAAAISLLGSDALSPLLNLGWLALALLAGWCIGAPLRARRGTLAACALVIGVPIMAQTQAGQAGSDIAGLAMLLSALALIFGARGGARLPPLVLACLACGFAIGAKNSLLAPGAATVLLALRLRPRSAFVLAGATFATCGFWLARNAVEAGNPFGVVKLPLLSVPQSPLERFYHAPLYEHLTDGHAWSTSFRPGLHQALGPLWWLLLALPLAGVIGAFAGPSRQLRALAAVVVVAAAGYLALPTGASGYASGPTLFANNVRYATPALALGCVLFALVAARRRAAVWLLVGAAIVTQLGSHFWHAQLAGHVAALAGAGLLVLLASAVRRGRRPAVVLVLLAAIALGGWAAERHYLASRYRSYRPDPALGQLFRWAHGIHNARIALAGTVLQYPLYGADSSNRVDWLGRRTAGANFAAITSCRDWRAAINRGRYDYIVVTLEQLDTPPRMLAQDAWTREDPAVRPVLSFPPEGKVYRTLGALRPDLCPRAS